MSAQPIGTPDTYDWSFEEEMPVLPPREILNRREVAELLLCEEDEPVDELPANLRFAQVIIRILKEDLSY